MSAPCAECEARHARYVAERVAGLQSRFDLCDSCLAERARYMDRSVAVEVLILCERYGFGAVMQSIAEQWAEREPIGALTVGPTRGEVRLRLGVLSQRAIDAAHRGSSVCIICGAEVADLAVHVCAKDLEEGRRKAYVFSRQDLRCCERDTDADGNCDRHPRGSPAKK